jgi:pantetheine-phosphate adenylyltransferase
VTERIAVYPGSFDPVTFGHLDILDRAAAIFDRVVIGVLENPGKTPLFTAAERVEMIRACLESRERIQVTTFDGLTVDFAAATGAIAIVRGLRVISDFESEFQMALMNRRLNPAVNTVFLMTSFSNVFISSSLIKEVCHLGGNVNEMAPPVSVEAMHRRFAEQREREARST